MYDIAKYRIQVGFSLVVSASEYSGRSRLIPQQQMSFMAFLELLS